ncbi:MAG: ATP-binding protein, partial [Methanomassiliicoccales archaeon]
MIEENRAEIMVDPLPTIMADESQMVQLMQNLIGNAVKFHGPERPIIRISSSGEATGWIFAVKDNGIGL